MKIPSFSLVLPAILGLACLAPSQMTAQTRLASVEGITQYRLDNGLTVLLFPDNSKPTVTVNITYMVGSRHEGYGESGMAHLLEHMVFKGTAKRGDIMTELRAHSANFNGTTSYDRTNYFETLPSSDENLRWALEMEADRMVNSRVSRQDLDSEMTVVRNEFERGENSPTRVLNERVEATAFLWHGYGRSTIGARSDIENVPIERLQAFYRNYYQPDNAMLVVAGKFDQAKTLAAINQTVGAVPKPARTLIQTYTQEPVQDGEREVVLRRVGDTQALMAAYHTPAGSHPDAAAIEVLAAVLSDAPSGRLYKALVETKKATAATGESYQLHDPGLMLFSVEARKESSLEDAEKAMLSVIDGVVKEPPSKEEVDRARTRLLKQIELSLNNSARVGVELSEWQAMGDWRLLFLFRDRIRDVTPEDVARVAKAYLKESNRTLGRFIPVTAPDRAEIPPPQDVTAMVKDYKGQAPVEQGEDFDPSPANIDARTVRVTLPSGLKLAMLSKKTRGGTVTARIDLHFGDEKTLAGKTVASQIAGGLLMRGTQKHNRQQLQDELDRLKAQVNANAALTGANVTINTLRGSFLDTLKLAGEILREPVFPETEFEQFRQASLARIEAGRSEPQAIAMNALNRHLQQQYTKGDPRYVPTFDEQVADLKGVTLAEVKKFYADFYGASNAELTVVGDFDPEEVRKVATELFGGWKSAAPYETVIRTWTKVASANNMIETPDKANAFFAAGTTLSLTEDDPDYAALLMANEMFGGDLQSRLFKRIREKEGLSYAVQSAFNAGIKEKYAMFMAVAISNPENTPKVENSFKDELKNVLTAGFTAEEVATAKKTFLEDRQVGRSQDAGLLRVLQRNAQYGWTMTRDADLEKKITALTPADINAAARRNLNPDSLSLFKAGDFKKAGVTQ